MTEKEKITIVKDYLSKYQRHREQLALIEANMTTVQAVKYDGIKSAPNRSKSQQLDDMIYNRDRHYKACKKIYDEINGLSDDQAVTFLLGVFVHGLKYQQIADVMYYSLCHIKQVISKRSYLLFYDEVLKTKAN